MGFGSWSAASGATIPNGTIVEIIGDTGTHPDPVSGATVSNSGTFVRVAAGLQFLRADTLANTVQKSEIVFDDDGLVSLPGGSKEVPTDGVPTSTIAINPSSYAAGTSLAGQNTSTGAKAINVRGSSGSGMVFSTSSDGASMGASAGTAGTYVLASVDTGLTHGLSTVVMKAFGTQGGGPFVGGFFGGTPAVSFWIARVNPSGIPIISKVNGASYATLTTQDVAQDNEYTVASGDQVGLGIIEDDGIYTVVLYVNGEVVLTHEMTSGEKITYRATTATHYGVWGIVGAAPTALGLWGYGQPVTELVEQKAITIDLSTQRLSGDIMRAIVGPLFDIRDYGGAADGVVLKDVSMTAGSKQVSSASYAFTKADIGKRLGVLGAGVISSDYTTVANDGVFVSEIKSVSGGVATMLSAATNTVSNAECVFGTRNDRALIRAQAAAKAAGGGTVMFPPGISVVASSLGVEDYVSFAGYNRFACKVYVLKVGTGGTGSADWLTCSGRDLHVNPLRGSLFYDFTIEAKFMAHTGAYTAALKPLNIYNIDKCAIERMLILNSPATAIPFDHSLDQCWIRNNFIYRPGRLARPGVGPGGSGIGLGTKGEGATEPTIVEGNVIIGDVTDTFEGVGHNGIFVEAQTGADASLGTYGYRIVNNTIIGMPFGVSDAGANGSIIAHNTIRRCWRAVRLSKTSLADSYAGRATIIADNVMEGCTGPGENDGMGISIYTRNLGSNVGGAVHTIIRGNQILNCKGWGISIASDSTDTTDATLIEGVLIQGNMIGGNGKSAIRLSGKLRQISIQGNQLVGNGTAGVAGDAAGVKVEPGSVLTGGRIQDNDIYDYQVTPTQTATVVTTGATLTGVRISGNTGDA